MKVGRGSTRLRIGLVTGVALLAFAALFVSSASAQPSDLSGLPADTGSPFNPQDTNVPYLAWRGEEVRLVRCTESEPIVIEPGDLNENGRGFGYNDGNLDVNMDLYDYTTQQPDGTLMAPTPVTSSASVFYDYENHRICARQTWISPKPGLAIIKLTIAYKGIILAQNDFLVGWMSISSPTITNPGSVTELPGSEPGNSVNVQVKGSIPLDEEFEEDYGLPATLTMPDDWATWADAMASTSYYLSGNPGDPPASAYWDIHDSSGPLGNESPDGSPDVHVDQVSCPGSTPSSDVDQVDNCAGGWSFSRVFGDFSSGGGPFDPSFPYTLLSDGRLNSGDAPMPAAKIVFTSTGGMGGFVDDVLNRKACVYNRNSDVADDNCVTPGSHESDPHALYSPYYYQYIPATSRGYGDPYDSSSGVDGPFLDPGNFTGFGWYGSYDNWQIAQTTVQQESQPTDCLIRDDEFRYTNGGATQVIEFTDEHGEARADWAPGWNADFFAGQFVDDNGGCDLQGIQFPAQTITAAARYPFQPVAHDVAASGTITKNIENLFNKSVSCVRKNNVSSAVAYICTASAQDIAGNGDTFNGEQVCFSREPDGTWYDVGGSSPSDNSICRELEGGTDTTPATVSVETPATLLGSQVDISANFTDEHLLRDACIVVGQASSTDGPCGSTSSGTTTGGGTTTTGGGTTTGDVTSKTPPSTTHNSTKAHVVKVMLVATSHGRVLKVKVASSAKSAKINVRLKNAHGKLLKNANRTIKANRLVQVKPLHISSTVKKALVVLK